MPLLGYDDEKLTILKKGKCSKSNKIKKVTHSLKIQVANN